MAYRVQDLPALLADFGESWTAGSDKAVGILDDADEVRAHGEGFEVVGKVRSVLFRASDLVDLVVGGTLTREEDGTAFHVRDIQREGRDAAFQRVIIVEVVA